MDIPASLREIYQDAPPCEIYGGGATPWIVRDDGHGPFISDWNYSKPQPSDDAIAAAWLVVQKKRAREAIKAKRDTIKSGGVKVGTKWYHSDESSRTQYIGFLRMADAAVAAGGTGATTLQYGGQDIQWKTMDGTFIKMTVQRANDVFNAVSGLDFAAFGAAEAHKAAMEASADPASYDFAAGWPATFQG